MQHGGSESVGNVSLSPNYDGSNQLLKVFWKKFFACRLLVHSKVKTSFKVDSVEPIA